LTAKKQAGFVCICYINFYGTNKKLFQISQRNAWFYNLPPGKKNIGNYFFNPEIPAYEKVFFS